MTPQIVEREEQPYVAVRGVVTMETIPEIADRFPEVFAWLGKNGITPADAPFFKYNLIDMERHLEMEAGVPIDASVAADREVLVGVLPAGRYATVSHVGHPQELVEVTRELLEWASAEGLAWDMAATDKGDRWTARLELLLTDPSVEPDMNKWETRLMFKLAD